MHYETGLFQACLCNPPVTKNKIVYCYQIMYGTLQALTSPSVEPSQRQKMLLLWVILQIYTPDYTPYLLHSGA